MSFSFSSCIYKILCSHDDHCSMKELGPNVTLSWSYRKFGIVVLQKANKYSIGQSGINGKSWLSSRMLNFSTYKRKTMVAKNRDLSYIYSSFYWPKTTIWGRCLWMTTDFLQYLINHPFSGEHGGYSRNSHHPSVSSVYSTLPHVQMTPNYQQAQGPMRTRQIRLSTDLDLDLSGGHYTPLTTPIVIETQQPNEGPICASSPKRTVSAFTTFGPSRSNVTTPMSPHGGSPTLPNSTSNTTLGGGPATGHLVWILVQ